MTQASVDTPIRTRIVACALLVLLVASFAVATVGAREPPEEVQTESSDVAQITLGTQVSGWIVLDPPANDDSANPTLEFEVGRTYEVTLRNLDGAPHNFAILDSAGNALVRTETFSSQGTIRTVRFTATASMVTYLCEVHPTTMQGSIRTTTPTPVPDDSSGASGNETTDASSSDNETTEVEPNDDVDSATPLASGGSTLGNISSITDRDWFAIDATDGDQISVDLSRLTRNGTLTVSLYAPDGRLITGTPVLPLERARLEAIAPRTGRYFVVVTSTDGVLRTQGTGPYVLAVVAAPPSRASEVEPNDGPATATPIEPSAWVSGSISSPDDTDGYAIAAAQGDVLVVTVTRTDGTGTVVATGWDPTIGPVTTSIPVGPGETARVTIVPERSGEYHVVVQSAGGTGDYVLRVDVI